MSLLILNIFWTGSVGCRSELKFETLEYDTDTLLILSILFSCCVLTVYSRHLTHFYVGENAVIRAFLDLRTSLPDKEGHLTKQALAGKSLICRWLPSELQFEGILSRVESLNLQHTCTITKLTSMLFGKMNYFNIWLPVNFALECTQFQWLTLPTVRLRTAISLYIVFPHILHGYAMCVFHGICI